MTSPNITPTAAPKKRGRPSRATTSASLTTAGTTEVLPADLLVNNRMSSDVWLYNRLPAPESVDWRDRTAAPFLNPAKFCGTPALPRLRNDAAVRCAWTDTGVELFVDGLHWANLEAGISPGWSRGAGQPGPLAKPLRRA